MTEAMESQPFTIYMGDGATPEVFARVPEAGDIKVGGGSQDEINVTSHDSLVKEFLLGLSDSGECTIPVNFIPGNLVHQALWDASKSRELVNFQVKDEYDPSVRLDFSARVKGIPFDFPVSGAVKADVTLRVVSDVELVNEGSGS